MRSRRSIRDGLRPYMISRNNGRLAKTDFMRSRNNVRLAKVDHKRSQNNDRSSEADCISNLHESVMSHIMSRLPTEDAIRTTILSKDWKYKWTCMYHIDIKDFVSEVPVNIESFGNFVDNVVSLAHDLKSFCISFKGIYDSIRVTTWIYEIFRRENIEKLELFCWNSFKDRSVVLPWSLLYRPSLKKLELAIPNCIFDVDAMNSFLNLRTFHLCELQILNGNPETDILVLNFPLLEVFQVTRCKWVNVKFVKIYAPVLNTFTSETSKSDGQNDYSIEIIGSMLSPFKSSGGFPDKVVLTGSQVVTLSVDNYYNPAMISHPRLLTEMQLQVSKIMNESSRLNELEFSCFIFVWLLLGTSLPRYDELKRLSLLDPCDTRELSRFIHNAPLLNFLHVNMLDWDKKYDYDAVEHYPSCIKSHLEDVHLHLFEALPCQYGFAKFLLKNCLALKTLTVHYPSWSKEECFKLEHEPRISSSVRVVFSLHIEDEYIEDSCPYIEDEHIEDSCP